MALREALEFTLRWEGGFSSHPADKGGPTQYGITTAVYDWWRQRQDLPPRDVREIENHEVEAIYREDYWERGKCDQLLDPVNRVHFDACVNHGPFGAAKLLQRAAGVDDDGIIGPVTLAAVRASDTVGEDMIDERLRYFARIVKADPSQSVFIEGWINRCIALRRSIR